MTGPDSDHFDAAIAEAISVALDRLGPGRSLCPSVVAREIAADWRPLMPSVRRVAQEMADQGLLRVTQRSRPVDAVEARGPIRLSHPNPQDSG